MVPGGRDWAAAEERANESSYADTVYFNADVVTMDTALPRARMIAVKGDTIMDVGRISGSGWPVVGPSTKLVDLKGATVLPGFIDPHSHFLGYAFLGDIKHFVDVSSVNLYFKPHPDDPRCLDPTDSQRCFIPVRTQDDVIERLTRAAQRRGATAVYAAGYDTARLGHSKDCKGPRTNVGFECPNFENGKARASLDAISTKIPIVISALSGHIAFVNTKALEKLNICGTDVATASCKMPTTNPLQERKLAQLGQLNEDLALYADGYVIGEVLQSDPVSALVAFNRGVNLYAGHGYTLVQEGAASLGQAEIYLAALAANPRLPLSVGLMMYDAVSGRFSDTIELAKEAKAKLAGQDDIFVAGLKSFADGSPQGYTAFLSRPYQEVFPPFTKSIFPQPYTGLPDLTSDQMRRRALAAHRAGYPLMIHQNGDQAIENAVEALIRAKRWRPSKFRDVVLHDPFISLETLAKVKRLNNSPISFLIPDLYFWGLPLCHQVLGPAFTTKRYAPYPARSAARMGLRVTLHSDSPVSPPDPLFMIWVAKTRKVQQPDWYTANAPDCPEIMAPEESITIRQGLEAFTVNAAWQYRLLGKMGTITPGKLANLVIMSANPLLMEGTPDDLRTIRILGTVHKGRFRRNPHADEQPIWPGD
jgi:predicted amidohydrolase YtcJ